MGTTKVCNNNAFNPLWNQKFKFGLIHAPELAVIRFSVYNQSDHLCQATLPLNYLRQGYRSVRLRNAYGEVENCLQALLVHVKIDSKATEPRKKWKDIELKDMLKNYKDLTDRKNSTSSLNNNVKKTKKNSNFYFF